MGAGRGLLIKISEKEEAKISLMISWPSERVLEMILLAKSVKEEKIIN